MSATELLAELKALPREEQVAFATQFRRWEAERPLGTPHAKVQWPDPSFRHQHIFGEAVLPNMVLLARDEERF
jgi:hypothetical protein